MKKLLSLTLALALVLSFAPSSFAARFNTVERQEAETLKLQKAQGEAAAIDNANYSGGKGMELKVTAYENWLKNDFMRFAVPINQRAVFNIRLGVKKGPDQGIMQLWFPDINARIGQKIDLYSPTVEYAEIDLGDHMCNIQYSGRQFEVRVDGKNPQATAANINVDYIQLSYAKEWNPPAGKIPYLDGTVPVANGDEPYAWGQVNEGGTGRSNHLAMHPMDPDLVYMGTDMGGLYRWNNDTYEWKPLMDTAVTSDKTEYLGIDGVALDPQNPDVVYVCVGTSSAKGNAYMGAVLKSTNRGDTWVETGFKSLFSSNVDPSRSMHERIAVDPGNSNNVWVTTPTEGFFRSKDAFATWEKVTLPVELTKNKVFPGIIAFDERTKTEEGCTRFYVSVYDYGLLVTEDGGETWSDVIGCPSKRIRNMEYSEDGTFAVSTSNAGLWTFKDGVWMDVSPTSDKVWGTVAIGRNNSKYMITSWNKGPVGSFGQYTYYTLDGGQNWRMITDDMVRNHTTPRLEWGAFMANVTDYAIDPRNPGRVMMCGWSNFFMTEDIFAANPVFTNHTKGVEHGCVNQMISLPVGARLIVSAYDHGGGRYTDVTQYYDEMLPPKETNPARMAFSENDPNFIVRAGKGHGVYSTDNGINWRSFPTVPEELKSVEVHDVVVSSDVNPETGLPVISMLGYGQPPFVTFDLGATWTKSEGGENWHNASKWGRAKRLAADPNSPETIYYLGKTALYRSDDWGKTYVQVTSFSASEYNEAVVRTSFGKNSGVFVSDSGNGKLYRSTSKGELFTEIGNFTWVRDFSFGKEKEPGSPATMFVWGTNNGVRGLHRSHDNGKTWEVLHDDKTAKEKLVTTMVICADRQTYGVIYVGSSGRGIKFGVPRDAENIFYTNKDDKVKVMINNQLEIFDVEPQIIDSRTMVPMRQIFEDVGAVVEWDDATKTVTARRKVSDNYGIDETTVSLTIGSNKITINGEEQTMDVVPQIVGGRTMVPVRFISEALGAKVDWVSDLQLVKIVI